MLLLKILLVAIIEMYGHLSPFLDMLSVVNLDSLTGTVAWANRRLNKFHEEIRWCGYECGESRMHPMGKIDKAAFSGRGNDTFPLSRFSPPFQHLDFGRQVLHCLYSSDRGAPRTKRPRGHHELPIHRCRA